MKKKTESDSGTEGLKAALKRAALRARKVAFETRTPLVLFENGKIVFRKVTRKMLKDC